MAPLPQEPASPFGIETTKPVGRVSVKATPERATELAAGFVMVKVSTELALGEMAVGLKAAAMAGGATITMPAEAVAPVPPSVEVMAPVVLFCWPATVPLTFTEKVQEELCARVAAERLMTLLNRVRVAVMAPPPQVPVRPLGVARTRPAGKVSLKAMPLSEAAVLLFCTVKLREVEPSSGMLAAPKALLRTGGTVAALTVTEAVEVLPAPALVEVTCTLLFFTPLVLAVTFTEKVQEALVARVAPARLTTDEAAVAVMVPPPQEPVSALGVATTKPDGNASVKATPASATVLAMGLAITNVNEVEAPDARLAAPKDLVMAGGVATLRLAEAVLPVPPLVALTKPVTLV